MEKYKHPIVCHARSPGTRVGRAEELLELHELVVRQLLLRVVLLVQLLQLPEPRRTLPQGGCGRSHFLQKIAIIALNFAERVLTFVKIR